MKIKIDLHNYLYYNQLERYYLEDIAYKDILNRLFEQNQNNAQFLNSPLYLAYFEKFKDNSKKYLKERNKLTDYLKLLLSMNNKLTDDQKENFTWNLPDFSKYEVEVFL